MGELLKSHGIVNIDKVRILNELMIYKGFSKKSELSKYLEVRPNVLSNWFSRNTFDEKIFFKKFPELNKVWILTGEGEMIKRSESYKLEVNAVPYDDYMVVEYADLSTAAGMLGVENPAVLPEMKRRLVPKEFDNGNYLVVKVDGDSMDNGSSISIPDGTEILIKEYPLHNGDKLPIRNNLFVVVSKTGTVFKQIVEHNTELGFIKCHSYNSKYNDFNIPMEEVIQIFIYRKIVSFRPSIPEITN